MPDAAEGFPERFVVSFGFEVPERDVERSDGVVGDTVVTAFEVLVDHALPETGNVPGVLPDEDAFDEGFDDWECRATASSDAGEFGVGVEFNDAATAACAAHWRVGVAHASGHGELVERRGYAGNLHLDLSGLDIDVWVIRPRMAVG